MLMLPPRSARSERKLLPVSNATSDALCGFGFRRNNSKTSGASLTVNFALLACAATLGCSAQSDAGRTLTGQSAAMGVGNNTGTVAGSGGAGNVNNGGQQAPGTAQAQGTAQNVGQTTVTDPVTGQMTQVPANTDGSNTGAQASTTTTAAGGAGAGGGSGIFIDDSDGAILTTTEPVPMDGQLVEGDVCNSKDVQFESLTPTVMILVDRSTSMFRSDLANGSSPMFGTFPDRWEAVRDALSGLSQFSGDVAFSLATFTGLFDQETQALISCPEMEHLDMVPATDNFDQILAALPPSAEAIPPGPSETPTGEAVTAAYEALAALESAGNKYILLVTDGEPDTCTKPNPQCGQDPAIGAVQAAYAAGVSTYVIGLGDDAGEKFLNDVAHAGQGLEVAPPPDDKLFCISDELRLRGETEPPDFYQDGWRDVAAGTYADTPITYADTLYYQPGDSDALRQAMSGLVAGVRSCDFEMDTAVDRSRADLGAVRMDHGDGTADDLVYGAPDGWMLDPDNDYTVVVTGAACDAIQADTSGSLSLRIEFPCEVRLPKIK